MKTRGRNISGKRQEKKRTNTATEKVSSLRDKRNAAATLNETATTKV